MDTVETQVHVLTIQSLDSTDVVMVQSESVLIPRVHRTHECAVELGVAQSEGVAYLMGGYDAQVCSVTPPLRPHLIGIEVNRARLRALGVTQNLP